MPEILTNPDRAAFIWRITKEINTSPDVLDGVIPRDYLEALLSRKILSPGDIKILLDTIPLAISAWNVWLVGLIRDTIENEYSYLFKNTNV